jgi:hypothetical protein
MEHEMATSSHTWFYSTPEPRPYYIEERVNHTLWKHRLQGLMMTCTKATVPIEMQGKWRDAPVIFEWKPGDYFVLRSDKEYKELIGVLRQVLMMRPALSYTDSEGMYAVEWHSDGGQKRWREIQGKPQFVGLRRLR